MNTFNETSNKGEMSIKDVINFWVKNWKIIICSTFFFGGVSLGYNVFTQPHYELKLLIKIAQLPSLKSNLTYSDEKLIERPSQLIYRIKYKADLLNQAAAQHCGLSSENNPSDLLAKGIDLTPIRNIDNLIEVKVRIKENKLSESCALAIFNVIENMQEDTIQSHIIRSKEKLEDYKKKRIEIIDESKRYPDSKIHQEEILFLAENIDYLENYLNREVYRAKLIGSINSIQYPIFISNIIGILAGLFFGLFFAVVRTNFKNKN